MAAGPWNVYGAAIEGIAKGTIDLDTDSFRMALVTSTYTPTLNTDDTWSDVSANEVANGNGYTTHGNLLTVTVSRSGGTVTVDCDDQSWTSSTITAKYAVISRSGDGTTLAAGDLVLCYSDLDDGTANSVSTTNGTFAVNINASGILTLAQA